MAADSPTAIHRSTGFPLTAGGVFCGMAGGGWSGITAELDQVVQEGAEALAAAYGTAIEIRFNSDRESGGAFLLTPDGSNNNVGICASVIPARTRRRWELEAIQLEGEAETGLVSWQPEPLTDRQRDSARSVAVYYRRLLERRPEGELTVLAHIRGRVVHDPQRLAELDGWNGWDGDMKRSYHHGPAASVKAALGRCLYFAPSGPAQ